MELGSLILFALPVLLLLLMFSSQRKRQRAFEQLQAGLQPGQEVLTTSGLIARIVSLDEAVAVLEPAPGVRLRWDRRAIAGPATAVTTSATDAPAVGPTDDARPTDEK